MARDWKLLAEALALEIPAPDIEKVSAPLDALEAAFRPLAAAIPHEVEPAVIFLCPEEETAG